MGLAIGALLLIATEACSDQPSPREGPPRAIDETVAPQSISSGLVSIQVSPARIRAGRIEVATRLAGRESATTSDHVWLDRKSGQAWETAWLLDGERSVSVAQYRAGGVPLTSLALTVPGSLSFKLDPAPPPGEYRLRLQVIPASATAPLEWAAATIEILRS
jgi:hypothetical protein